MSRFTSRTVSFAGSSVAVEYDEHHGSPGARIVDVLFSAMSQGEHPEPHATFCILWDEAGGRRVALQRGATVLYEGESPATLATLLLNAVTEHLAAECRRGVLIHAAALGWRGRAVILPGRTGAGKTTLAAWLMKQGFDYLGDELVYIPDRELTVQSFPRPLAIKAAGLPLVGRLLDLDKHAAQMIAAPETTLIPPKLLRFGTPVSQLQAAVTLSFQFQQNARFSLQALSKAEAGLVLMGCLVNARNLPGHGFGAVARLAREVPARKMVYGDPADVVAPLTTLLESCA